MNNQGILCSKEEGIGLITLNRPGAPGLCHQRVPRHEDAALPGEGAQAQGDSGNVGTGYSWYRHESHSLAICCPHSTSADSTSRQ